MSTNKSSIGPVVLDLALMISRKMYIVKLQFVLFKDYVGKHANHKMPQVLIRRYKITTRML